MPCWITHFSFPPFPFINSRQCHSSSRESLQSIIQEARLRRRNEFSCSLSSESNVSASNQVLATSCCPFVLRSWSISSSSFRNDPSCWCYPFLFISQLLVVLLLHLFFYLFLYLSQFGSQNSKSSRISKETDLTPIFCLASTRRESKQEIQNFDVPSLFGIVW